MRNTPVFGFLLLLTVPLPLAAAELIPLKDGERDAGSIEWPRPELRIVEADVGELDPRWTYTATVSDFHVSSGKITFTPSGPVLPEGFMEETDLKSGGNVKLTVKTPENLTNSPHNALVLEIRKGGTPENPTVLEIVTDLPKDASPGWELELLFKLPEPLSGVLLPGDAVWRRGPDQEAGKEPGSWVFAWEEQKIRRIKIQPGPETERGVEIPAGVLPGEKYLAGDLRELYIKSELQAPPPKGEQYTVPVAQAAHRRIWSKFLWAWGGIGLAFLVWITWYLRKHPRGEG